MPAKRTREKGQKPLALDMCASLSRRGWVAEERRREGACLAGAWRFVDGVGI